MPPTTPYAVLGLRSHPLAPERTIEGRPVRFDYTKGPLEPRKDLTHLQYYFDLYTWVDREQLGALGSDGRIRVFPDRGGPFGTIIVISGVSGTGRTSLEELLLFEIGSRSKSPPVVTDHRIGVTSKRVQDASNFASFFIARVEEFLRTSERRKEVKNLPKALRATVKEWRDGLVADDPNTEFLFTRLADHMRNSLPDTPIVFRLDGTNHMNTPDTWTPACTMLRNLADYIILSLSDQDFASYLRTSLQDIQFRILWIDLPRVDAEKTRRFLARRLELERSGAPMVGDELFPFTEEALSALFAPTGKGPASRHPISVAIQNLKGAFDKKLADITALLQDPATPGAIPAARLQITGDEMRSYFFR